MGYKIETEYNTHQMNHTVGAAKTFERISVTKPQEDVK